MTFVDRMGDVAGDVTEGFKLAPLWWRLGIDQTVARYRRTALGPFWLASSMVATGFALSIVFGTIFGGDWRQNFGFILSGVLSFNLVSSMISDGAQTFINASGTMQIRKLPLSFHSLLVCDKSLINFTHQVVAFWVVTAVLRLFPIPHWQLLFTLPLVMLIGFLMSFPLGMVSVRYRDVSYFISFVLQAAFMLTPVFWRRSQIPPKLHWIVDWNPLAHMMEILRQPFLGHPAPMEDLIGVFYILIIALVLALVSLFFWRRRVVFWL